MVPTCAFKRLGGGGPKSYSSTHKFDCIPCSSSLSLSRPSLPMISQVEIANGNPIASLSLCVQKSVSVSVRVSVQFVPRNFSSPSSSALDHGFVLLEGMRVCAWASGWVRGAMS